MTLKHSVFFFIIYTIQNLVGANKIVWRKFSSGLKKKKHVELVCIPNLWSSLTLYRALCGRVTKTLHPKCVFLSIIHPRTLCEFTTFLAHITAYIRERIFHDNKVKTVGHFFPFFFVFSPLCLLRMLSTADVTSVLLYRPGDLQFNLLTSSSWAIRIYRY